MTFIVDNLIYVDNLDVSFTTREQIYKGVQLLQTIFDDIGLEIHIGKRVEVINEDGQKEEIIKASKTECSFVTNENHFKQLVIKAREDATIFPSEEEVNKSETKKGARSNLEERFYDKSKETQDVKVKNEFVS